MACCYTVIEMSTEALIKAEGLTKRFGVTTALDGVHFQITEGITGLLGANGAGKTTAIKLFLGLIEPTGGRAVVLGDEPYNSLEVRSRVGYMPEHDCLPTAITASEFLSHMAQVSGLPPAEARTRSADVLRHVGLDEERYRSIGEYSTGMKQRVKLAQSIVHDPLIVLLDEPTAGLDPAGRDEMLDLIRRIGREFDISVLLSTHLMGDVERTCDRIVLLEGGQVMEEGAVTGFTQETETVFIEVDDNRQALVEALGRRGIGAEIDGSAVVVDQVRDGGYDAIRDAVVESNARLRRLAPRRHQLAEIFRSRS